MTEFKHSEILKAVDQLFDNPRKWIRGYLAKDAEGLIVSPESPRAECFCFLGGVAHVLSEKGVKVDTHLPKEDIEYFGGAMSEWYNITARYGEEYAKCGAPRKGIELLPYGVITSEDVYRVNDMTVTFEDFKADLACAITKAEEAEAIEDAEHQG